MPKDFLGREIAVGDFVVYATREGSKHYMRSGEVIRAHAKCLVVEKTDTKRVVQLYALERVVVVPRMPQ